MNAASPAGEHAMCSTADSTLPTHCCLPVPSSIVRLGTSSNVPWTECSLVKREQRMPPLPCWAKPM